MGVSIGSLLKSVALFLAIAALLLMALTTTQPEKVHASANLSAFLTVPPTDWEPSGYNLTGTAPYYITHTLNWSNVKIMGNVGIGDGSYNTLNRSSNQDVNCTPNYYMAADASMAPWNPARITSPGGIPGSASSTSANATTDNETATTGNKSNTTAGNNLLNIPSIGNVTLAMPHKIGFDSSISDNNTSASASNTSNQSNETSGSTGSVTFNKPLQDVYHPILMGRPVDDLLYEYPLAQSITMYSRLTGLMMPCGLPANIGIRCCGYGY